MKKTLTNIAAAAALVGGLAAAAVAPWWAVWLLCAPAAYAGIITLIKTNTDWISRV